MKLVLDVMGCDDSSQIVIGGIKAINKHKDLIIVFVGDENIIKSELDKLKYNKEQIEILHTTCFISNDEAPAIAVREKVDSSVVMGLNYLRKNDEAIAMVSAGSTGALLAGAFMRIGRIKGVSRPALCPILPSLSGRKGVFLDCGANVDCKPINLAHFAIMGSKYAELYLNIKNPTVALLSNGTEEKKGNEVNKQAYAILKQLPINFIGNIEGRDVLVDGADVVVTDGFNGNIFLKASEGALKFAMGNLKKSIKASKLSMFGSLFMKKSFANLKSKLNYHSYGGSILLGVKNIVIKTHGATDAHGVECSIEQALDLNKQGIIKAISDNIEISNITTDEE